MDEMVGKRIKVIRPLTRAELGFNGWHENTTAIELDDGTLIFASRDSEGNGPGALFGQKGKDGFELLAEYPPSNRRKEVI